MCPLRALSKTAPFLEGIQLQELQVYFPCIVSLTDCVPETGSGSVFVQVDLPRIVSLTDCIPERGSDEKGQYGDRNGEVPPEKNNARRCNMSSEHDFARCSLSKMKGMVHYGRRVALKTNVSKRSRHATHFHPTATPLKHRVPSERASHKQRI